MPYVGKAVLGKKGLKINYLEFQLKKLKKKSKVNSRKGTKAKKLMK